MFFTAECIIDCNKRKINRHVWCVDNYMHYLPRDLCSIQEILTTDLVFFKDFNHTLGISGIWKLVHICSWSRLYKFISLNIL